MSPEMIGPVLIIELDAITVMSSGTLSGGCELFPVVVVHVPPHSGGFGLGKRAKPLKLCGALPLLR